MRTIEGYDVKIFTDNIDQSVIEQIAWIPQEDINSLCKMNKHSYLHIGPGDEDISVMEEMILRTFGDCVGPVVSCPWNPQEGLIMKDFSQISLMAVAQDRNTPELYDKLLTFIGILRQAFEQDVIVFVWHGSDARSRLVQMMVAALAGEFTVQTGRMPILRSINLTPPHFNWHNPYRESPSVSTERRVFRVCEAKAVERKWTEYGAEGTQRLARQWKKFAGTNASFRIVGEGKRIVEANSYYIADAVFGEQAKEKENNYEITMLEGVESVRRIHPQSTDDFIRKTIVRLVRADIIRTSGAFSEDSFEGWEKVRMWSKGRDTYKLLKEGQCRYLHHFARLAKIKVKISPEDLEREKEAVKQEMEADWKKIQAGWENPKRKAARRRIEKQRLISWAEMASKEDWEWSFLMEIIKIKLHWMAHYFTYLGHGVGDSYYAAQMRVAESLCGILIEGGLPKGYDYDSKEWKREYPYVNLRNARRFELVGRGSGSVFFNTDEQKVRFYKAYHLFFKYLKEKMLYWWD